MGKFITSKATDFPVDVTAGRNFDIVVSLPIRMCTRCIQGAVQVFFVGDIGKLLAVNIKGRWFVEELDGDIGAIIRCGFASLEEYFGEFVNILISSAPPVKMSAPFFFLMSLYPPPCYVDGQGFYTIPNFL